MSNDFLREKIKELRQNKILTQKQVGDYIGCSQRVYSNYELGKTVIPPDILAKLAKYHNTTVDYLLGISDRKMICIDGLTTKQAEAVKTIVSEFISGNNNK